MLQWHAAGIGYLEAWPQQSDGHFAHRPRTCQTYTRAAAKPRVHVERPTLSVPYVHIMLQMVKEGSEASTLEHILADIGPRASDEAFGEEEPAGHGRYMNLNIEIKIESV